MLYFFIKDAVHNKNKDPRLVCFLEPPVSSFPAHLPWNWHRNFCQVLSGNPETSPGFTRWISCYTSSWTPTTVYNVWPRVWWYNHKLDDLSWTVTFRSNLLFYLTNHYWLAQTSHSGHLLRFRSGRPFSQSHSSKYLHHSQDEHWSHPREQWDQ